MDDTSGGGDVECIHASHSDLLNAIRLAEQKTGHSFEELEDMSRRDDFPDLRSRSAWYAIGGLRDLMPAYAEGGSSRG